MKKFLWRKLLLFSNPSQPYFISKFLISGSSFLDHSKLGNGSWDVPTAPCSFSFFGDGICGVADAGTGHCPGATED
jgi:hypothetical protein